MKKKKRTKAKLKTKELVVGTGVPNTLLNQKRLKNISKSKSKPKK